jgi:hypothetical protein
MYDRECLVAQLLGPHRHFDVGNFECLAVCVMFRALRCSGNTGGENKNTKNDVDKKMLNQIGRDGHIGFIEINLKLSGSSTVSGVFRFITFRAERNFHERVPLSYLPNSLDRCGLIWVQAH